MKKGKILILIMIILLGTLLSPTFIHSSHAATGEVCLADPSASPSALCPASPAVFDGPKGQQIRIGVFIGGSNGLDGFDITLLANHTVLTPFAVDLAGSVLLGTPVVINECLLGQLVKGTTCSGTDTIDTLHLAATSALGSPLTSTPTSGLLFTAIYNITGTNIAGSPVSVGSQTGCSNTSVSNTCVTIANGTPSPDPETVQTGATFDNSASSTMMFVVLSSSSTNFGPEFPNTSNTAIINATAFNGFPGFGATDAISITDQASPGLAATIGGTNPCVTSGTSCAVTLTLTANAAGNYFVTVFGTYSTLDPSSNPDTLVSTISMTVSIYDYGLTVKSNSISFASGSTATDAISLSSLNNFAGTISLSVGAVLPSGLTITFNPNFLSLVPGVTVNSTATFTAAPSTSTTYHATIRASSGAHVKTSATIAVTVTANVPDFTMNPSPSGFTIAAGSSAASVLSISSVNGFSGTVNLNTTAVSPNLTVSIIPSSVTLTAAQSATSTVKISTQASTPSGTYSAAVAGISGTIFHTATITVTVGFNPPTGTGLVCIAKDGSTTCPVAPPIINSTNTSTPQLRVAVVVSSSSGLDGFDITLLADHTILKPAGVDLTGTVLIGTPNTLLECLSGVLIQGTTCTPTDTADTIHLASTSALGSPLTASPITGLLFTAIYNITGASPGTTIGFQTGCSQTSVTGGVCVTIANGSVRPDLENVQAGSFTNLPTFSLQTVSGVTRLILFPGTSDSSLFLNVTSINNFVGPITITDTVSPPGPTAALVPTSVTLNASTPTRLIQVKVTISSTVSLGTYNLAFTASNGTISRTLNIPVIVALPDFSITVSPQSLTFAVGQSGTATVTAASLGFKGNVTLTTVSPASLTSSVQQPVLSLTPNGTNSSILTIKSTSSTLAGTYTITITGTNGSLAHSDILTVNIADFILNIHNIAMSLTPGSSGATAVELHSLNFTGTVDLSASAPSGLTTNFGSSPILVSLIPSSDFTFDLIIFTSQSITAGTYKVNVTATSPTSTHTGTIFVTMIVAAPDFRITAQPNFMSLPQGGSGISIVILTGSNGFAGNVTLTASGPSIGPTFALHPSTVALNRTGFQGSSVLIVTAKLPNASLFPAPGLYDLTIGASSGSIAHAVTVMVSVTTPPPPDFTIGASPSFVEIRAGQNATSTITLTSLFSFRGNITLTSVTTVFFPPVTNPPATSLQPSRVTLAPGGTVTSLLLISTTRTTTPLLVGYQITVTGTNGTVSHSVTITLPVLPPLDTPPVANFTFTPKNPIVGQQVFFNGTLSFDPDGFVVLWIWNFGDGNFFTSSSPYVNHSYFSPGNYTVTLTVQDNAGLAGSKIETLLVAPPPPHDVSIIGIFVGSTTAVSSQQVRIEVDLRDDGTNTENVSVTVYANGHPVQTLGNLFISNCGSNCFYFVEIFWDTTNVAPGQYTISATISLPIGETDPTPQDNTFTDGTISVLPPPVIVTIPTSGTIGAKIVVEGTGFPNPSSNLFGPPYDVIEVSFDDMNLGFVVTTSGNFNFTLDVPTAQPGPHLIKALDEVSGAHTTVSFLVLPNQGSLAVTVTTGAIYFPGDTATIYVLTSLNGAAPSATSLQLKLILVSPNGTLTSLKTVSVSPGLYRATFAIPIARPLGTYSLIATAQTSGASGGTALGGFEVKPSWLSSHNSQIAGGTAVAGVFGFAVLAWRKGYFRRKNENEPMQPENPRRAEN